MDLDFSSEQESLRQVVRQYLAENCPIRPYVRAMLDDDRGTTDAVWEGLAALGATGILVPDRFGGAGAGMVDVGIVLEELGRALHPGPFLSSAVGAVSGIVATDAGDDHAELLAGLAEGSIIGTIALPPEPLVTSRDAMPSASSGAALTGSVRYVPDAAAADIFVVAASDAKGFGLYLVSDDARGLVVTPTPAVDGTRKLGTITLESTPARRLGSDDATSALRSTIDRVVIAMVTDGVGAAEAVLELTLAYAMERRQFDRPIGSFQAVQHMCADMFMSLEMGRAGVYYGLWAADVADADELHRAATMAKAFASDAFFGIGASAVQIHGGIGFTWEHDVHLYYKRLLSLQSAFGSSARHLEELASLVV